MAEPGKLLFVTPKSENKLRQLVGAPNTTDYSQDGTADTPQQSIRRKETNTDTADSTEYGGMLHLSIETETVDNVETAYLNIDWPESGSEDKTLVGMFENTGIYWYQREEMTGAALLVCFEPYGKTIFTVKAGELFVSYWKVIGRYDPQTKTVSQLWRSDRPGDGTLYDGYSGAFAIRYDKTAGTVQIAGGNVSVNNTNYTVSDYTGSMGESSTMYYYARHRVAQSATSGDEDQDLTEEKKQALRATIANCDTEISTAQQAINGYQQQINALVTPRTAAYTAISNAYRTRDSALTTEQNRHTTAINAENADYEQKVATENQLHADKLAQLDPEAEDYQSKLEAENTRHNTKLQQLLTAHNSAIATENSTNTTNINTINATLNTALSAQQSIISGLNSQIEALRWTIQTEQGIINTQTQTKNAACLQLYGVIPASAGVEITGLPSQQETTQTDQYLFIYLGYIRHATAPISSVSVDHVIITQAYLGSIMAFYRMIDTCEGLLS